jgi:hypothetical protein
MLGIEGVETFMQTPQETEGAKIDRAIACAAAIH